MSDARLRSAERHGALTPRDLARAGRLDELTTDQLAEARLVSPLRFALAGRASVEWDAVDTRRALLALALDLIGQPAIVRWAVDCAERVLPLWEKTHPDDLRPGLAIEGARAWADCPDYPCEDCRVAAEVASEAAWVARAAAWDAAGAAWDAAVAKPVAWAAGAAAEAAADAAAAAAWDVERAWQADHLRRALLDPRVGP